MSVKRPRQLTDWCSECGDSRPDYIEELDDLLEHGVIVCKCDDVKKAKVRR